MPCEFVKDPAAVLDYTIDWEYWLDTDTIDTSVWTVPAGIVNAADANTATTATIWLSGGTHDTVYSVTNTITTTGGRTDERSIEVHVENR